MYEGEVVGGEVVGNNFPSLEQVNKNALKRLNDLILEADAESIPGLIESLAKYNQSIRNNEIFTTETDEERQARERTTLVEGLLKH